MNFSKIERHFYICFLGAISCVFAGLSAFVITDFIHYYDIDYSDCNRINFNKTSYKCCEISINKTSVCGECNILQTAIEIDKNTLYSKKIKCNQNDNKCIESFTKIWDFNNTKHCQLNNDNNNIIWIPPYSYTITIGCLSIFGFVMIFSCITAFYCVYKSNTTKGYIQQY